MICALGARDYALVLGMPGTGKTSTIEFAIKCLVALGKRVLVSSYTHSAVDHLMVKLLDARVAPRCVARLATRSSAARLHPRVAPLRVGAKDVTSVAALRGALGAARVVGCTCLHAAKDAALARLKPFDVSTSASGQFLNESRERKGF